MPEYIILGSGFTGSRVAQRLAARGLSVRSIRRAQIDFTEAGALERLADLVTWGCVVLHSIPSLPDGRDAEIAGALGNRPHRVVYLSTTGVYGDAREVDERTPIAPRTPRELARVRTEETVRAGSWSTLILRPAAIYGPGRGVHVAMRERRYTLLGDGSNFISRIYVDDLARLAEAALLSDLTGAYPVADAYPCPSREIAEYCARLLGVGPPFSAEVGDVPESRRTNRRVDGSAICRLLGMELQYPSYREGIPAALELG